jgi:predicted RNA-binding protein YlqC (UPF0109 family)
MGTGEEGGSATGGTSPTTPFNSSPNMSSTTTPSGNTINIRRGNKKSKPKESVPVVQIPEETTNLYKKLGQTLPFDNMTVTIYIPTVCVGAVIGKKGATIAKIQKWAQQLAGIHSDQVRISVVHHPQSLAAGGAGAGAGAFAGDQQPFSPIARGGLALAEEVGAVAGVAASPSTPINPSNPGSATGSATGSTGFSSPGNPAVIPFTYTELDFTDTNWTPVVIRAPTMAGLVVSATILDICLEYVLDRTQIQYIFDLPISSQNQQTTSGNGASSSVVNNAHATIIGKRGQTIMTLSANSNCRIMVPPKQLKHDIVQLEGPLKECTSCLEAISSLLSSSLGDSPNTPNKSTIIISSSSANNQVNNSGATTPSSASKSIAKNAQIRSNDNKYQCSFVVRPLPSQTKLRNIARRTETVIRKTRRNKSDFEDAPASSAEKTATKKNSNMGKPDTSSSEDVVGDETPHTESAVTAEGLTSSAAAAADVAEGVSGSVPWQLTISGSSPNQVRAASKRLEMFKIADVPDETNINMNVATDDGTETDDADDLSATGGDNEEGTDRYSDSEGGAASSPPSAGISTPGRSGGGRGSANRSRRNRSNSTK